MQKRAVKVQDMLAYHSTLLMKALLVRMQREHIKKECESSWLILHQMFCSLTFFNQKVKASTCKKCMFSDHSKADINGSLFEAVSRLDRSRLSIPAWKRFRTEAMPQPFSHVCLQESFIVAFECQHSKPCDCNHQCIRVTTIWWTTELHLSYWTKVHISVKELLPIVAI